MDAKDRAEFILKHCFIDIPNSSLLIVQHQIEEAEREAISKDRKSGSWASAWHYGETRYAEGFKAAREKAESIAGLYGAQIVCGHINHDDCQRKTAQTIMKEISRMVP